MGIGNVLMGDDALGPWGLKQLEARWDLPDNVRCFDAGAAGLDLSLFLMDVDALIVIDGVKLKGPPGEVHTYRKPELIAGGLPIVMSPHEPTLREALIRLDVFGTGPAEVLLVGAIPETIETGAPLSQAVRGAWPAIEANILRELERLAAPASPRVPAFKPDVWWEMR